MLPTHQLESRIRTRTNGRVLPRVNWVSRLKKFADCVCVAAADTGLSSTDRIRCLMVALVLPCSVYLSFIVTNETLVVSTSDSIFFK